MASHFTLPLLAKELIEQSARLRTYFVRILYAQGLIAVAFIFMVEIAVQFQGAQPLSVLGRGRELFSIMVTSQFLGIYLLFPALTCGVTLPTKKNAIRSHSCS